jgi:hypothetical protein
MKSSWLFLATALALWGCSSSQEEATTKLGNESVRVERAGKSDAFGLPIVIVLNLPPVPKQIQGPSPPIKEPPKTVPKKSSWLPNLGL